MPEIHAAKQATFRAYRRRGSKASLLDFLILTVSLWGGMAMQCKVVAAITGMLIASTLIPVDDAAARRARYLEVTKECSADKGMAGDYCTFTSSNIDIISVGNRIYYDSAAGVPPGLLDSDAVIDAGDGNRGLGHCHLDLSNGSGICIFSDGTGSFAGFQARVNVSTTDGVNFLWQGTYSFDPAFDNQ